MLQITPSSLGSKPTTVARLSPSLDEDVPRNDLSRSSHNPSTATRYPNFYFDLSLLIVEVGRQFRRRNGIETTTRCM